MHIPFFKLPPIDLSFMGLGKVYWFSIFIVVGIFVGVMIYDRICTKGGDIDIKIARILPEIALLSGFIGAHLVHVLFYHPEMMKEDPYVLLKIWAGISSTGGFLGGALGVSLFLIYKKQALIHYSDRLLLSLSVAWIFGRLGCATSHDHPGAKTDFFLGVAFKDGVRHDLGLYEFLFTILLFVPVLIKITKKSFRAGLPTTFLLLSYSVVRFLLDFLRAEDRDFIDARYFGLTFAQYSCIAMFFLGVFLCYRLVRYRSDHKMQPALFNSPRH